MINFKTIATRYADKGEKAVTLLATTPKNSMAYHFGMIRVNWYIFVGRLCLAMPKVKSLWRPIYRNLSEYEHIYSAEAIIIFKKQPTEWREFHHPDGKVEAVPSVYKKSLLIDLWFLHLFFYWNSPNKKCSK